MKKRHRLGFYFSFRLVGLMVVCGLFCEKCGLKCDETAHFCTFLVFVDVGAGCFFVVQRVGMFFRRYGLMLLKSLCLAFFIVIKKVCSRDKKSFTSR